LPVGCSLQSRTNKPSAKRRKQHRSSTSCGLVGPTRRLRLAVNAWGKRLRHAKLAGLPGAAARHRTPLPTLSCTGTHIVTRAGMALAASNGTRVSCPALIKGEAAQCACVIGGRTHAVCRSLLTYNLDEIKKDSKKNNYVFYFIFSELTCLGLDSYKSSRGSSSSWQRAVEGGWHRRARAQEAWRSLTSWEQDQSALAAGRGGCSARPRLLTPRGELRTTGKDSWVQLEEGRRCGAQVRGRWSSA
jgi:hypothetical protein